MNSLHPDDMKDNPPPPVQECRLTRAILADHAELRDAETRVLMMWVEDHGVLGVQNLLDYLGVSDAHPWRGKLARIAALKGGR